MGRLSTVDDEKVFDAIGTHLSLKGSVALQDIVRETDTSIGSIYHRYGSREALLAFAWIDAVTCFQDGFLKALNSEKPNAGELAAMATPRFCRKNFQKARLLMSCRRQEIITPKTPQPLKDELTIANEKTARAIASFAKQNGHTLEACRVGLIGFPLGSVRLYLPHKKVPEHLDAFVARAYCSAMGG